MKCRRISLPASSHLGRAAGVCSGCVAALDQYKSSYLNGNRKLCQLEAGCIVRNRMVYLRGFEPLTSSMPLKRAPNCATGPHTAIALFFNILPGGCQTG